MDNIIGNVVYTVFSRSFGAFITMEEFDAFTIMIPFYRIVGSCFPEVHTGMYHIRTPFSGIIKDVKGRASCYRQDWIGGLHSGFRYFDFNIHSFVYPGCCSFIVSLCAFAKYLNHQFSFRILAPTMYIFFASALPVIAFGEQLSKYTGELFLWF